VGSLRSLAAISEEERTFDKAVATLKQASILEPQGNVESSSVQKLVKNKEAMRVFAPDLPADAAIVTEASHFSQRVAPHSHRMCSVTGAKMAPRPHR
jgi:hypothetical protein